MSETMSGQEIAYNELIPTISSIPDEKIITNSMPIDEAVGEAERVGALIKQFNAILRNTGIQSVFCIFYTQENISPNFLPLFLTRQRRNNSPAHVGVLGGMGT